jgi:hypothetical protein
MRLAADPSELHWRENDPAKYDAPLEGPIPWFWD